MHLDDIEKVIHMASSQNLHTTAKHFNITPGALSKTLKKVEANLATELFNRVGKTLVLNDKGKEFVKHSSDLVHNYQQLTSRFKSDNHKFNAVIAGPAILLKSGLKKLLPPLGNLPCSVRINNVFEGEAISQVASGAAHIALVTREALNNSSHANLVAVDVFNTGFSLAGAADHQLVQTGSLTLNKNQLLHAAFACPLFSPLCGLEQGIGSDGWQDDIAPRNIVFRCSDYSALIEVVQSGLALAYLPNFVIDDLGFTKLTVKGVNSHYNEDIVLIYKPSKADGWLNKLMYSL
ncbi:LysR family transcriptional regulator [Pseudoalteromonas sp. 13-15]|uniref:LysR family transcriptional regulator n=1 Tax=Pseudoalteromonas TaxID=53246 RepID=UPI00073183E9|nr:MULTISPECIES: LysR family transcriptional regulator [Pseudoalteromonas]AUL75258.1 LysR family transcriptional regulator [Pseudoalteromonas sp. 13-15]SIO22237.1 DNA-binding transcriptional regulator, LysR family [Pseudoalteromonas marina]